MQPVQTAPQDAPKGPESGAYEVCFYFTPDGIVASVNASAMAPGADEQTMPVESLDRAMQILQAVQSEVTGGEQESPEEDQGEPVESEEDLSAAMEQGFNGVRGRGL